MCWNQEASFAFAAIGFSVAAYSAYRKDPPAFWLVCGYFACMELLQAITYFSIDHCGDPRNQTATILGYLHICFQPFFMTLLALHFIPEKQRKRLTIPSLIGVAVCTIYMLAQLYPFPWAGQCLPAKVMTLCGEQWCASRGEWHIAWEMHLNGLSNWEHAYLPFFKGAFGYLIAAFIIPALIGSWRIALYYLISGPVLAIQFTDNPNEVSTIWCLFSTAILIVVLKTHLRNLMYVKQWPLWNLIK